MGLSCSTETTETEKRRESPAAISLASAKLPNETCVGLSAAVGENDSDSSPVPLLVTNEKDHSEDNARPSDGSCTQVSFDNSTNPPPQSIRQAAEETTSPKTAPRPCAVLLVPNNSGSRRYRHQKVINPLSADRIDDWYRDDEP